MDNVSEILFRVIISIICALVTGYLVPYLKTLRDDARWQRLIDMVQTAVEAAEQTIKEPGSGKEKKEAVVKFVSEWLTKQGITVTPEELDLLIEAAVKKMNDSKTKVPTSVINVS